MLNLHGNLKIQARNRLKGPKGRHSGWVAQRRVAGECGQGQLPISSGTAPIAIPASNASLFCKGHNSVKVRTTTRPRLTASFSAGGSWMAVGIAPVRGDTGGAAAASMAGMAAGHRQERIIARKSHGLGLVGLVSWFVQTGEGSSHLGCEECDKHGTLRLPRWWYKVL